MKRPQIFWTLTILLITCLVFIFSSIQAATSESSFDFDPATGTITSYKGTNPYVEIPDTIGGVKVTTIGVWAFNGCKSLTNITIPSSVTTIENGAFYNCTALTSVTIHSGVTTIEDSAFYICTALTSIDIPSSVTSIGNWTFSGCESLTNITIPSSVTSIKDAAFFFCTSLTAVYFKGNAPGLGGNLVFAGCASDLTVYYKESCGGSGFESWAFNTVAIDDIAPNVSNITPVALTAGTAISVASSETGTLYLVPKGTYADKTALDAAISKKTAAVSLANTTISIDTTGLANGTYQIYAVDSADIAQDPQRTALGLGPAPNLSAVSEDIMIVSYDLTSTQVNENEAIGTTVGMFIDNVSGRTFTYTLVTGTGSEDNSSFQVNGAALLTKAVFDFETKQSYQIRVLATDNAGLSIEKQFTITIQDLNEAPVDLNLTSTSINEIEAIGTIVGKFGATDPDVGDTFTYRLTTGTGSEDNGSFQISDGILQTKAVFDYETKNNYNIRVRVTDQGGLYTEKQFTITIKDIVEDPAAPGDLVTVFIDSGDNFTAKLDAAAGGDRNTIAGLRIITKGYALSGNDFTALKNMATGGTGLLTYLDLLQAVCENNWIPPSAFNNSNNNIILKKIILPNSINSIGYGAFQNCTSLTGSLTIPNGVTTIGQSAFYGCSGFTGNLTIPNGVITIGDCAFYGCSGFTGNLTIPNGVISIGYYAFRECSGFTGNLTIPGTVTSINDFTFHDCTGFNGNLRIESGVTGIGNYAFLNCYGFKGTLTIPDSVFSIGSYAFSQCNGFTGGITIPPNITSISEYVFYRCSGFNGNLSLPAGITSIGDGAFYGCSGLTGNLTIPDGVTSIGYGAFGGCMGLTGNLAIPNSITSLGSRAFSGCSGFNGHLSISDKLTSIPEFAFHNCSGLTGSLNIPPSITKIESSAFAGCSGFTGSLVIPNNVTGIGAGAFAWCSGFRGSLTIPDGVTAIEGSTFWGCSGFTGDLHIPNSVTSISGYAFRDCSGITGCLTIPNNITTITGGPFWGLPVTSVIYHGSDLTDLDLTNWFQTCWDGNTTLTAVDFANAAAISINANDFHNLTNINFSGMMNLASVTINAGKIDFSGGAAGVWYAGYTGYKNICCQRPAVFTKKVYPVDTLGLSSVFSPPEPIWVTASNIDITALTSADWFEYVYASEVMSRSYTLNYTGPDGKSEPFLDTTKPGNHTVSYLFSGYPGENYSRQFTVSTETFYTVSFNSNGGSTVNSLSVKNNTTATEPAAPSRSGYTFTGWYSNSGLTAVFNFNTPITANITLYAKWTQVKAVIASGQALSESTLDGRSLQVTLYGTNFNTTLLSGFTLTSTISNLSIEKITYIDNRHCLIELAYTGTTGIGSNIDLRIIIPGSRLTTGGDLTSNALTVSADLVPGKTTGTYIPVSNLDILTAYNSRNESSTYWNGTTFDLGKRTNGWNNDGWLYFPNVISATPNGYKIDRAELVLTLNGVSGELYLPRRIKIYTITDPNNYGTPYFGSTNGYRTGLNFSYRNNQTGKAILWKSGAANIIDMFGTSEPLDVWEFIPEEYGSGIIKLDVTAALRAWQSGSPNQGFYIIAESDLLANDQLHFNWRESTDGKPYLQLVYAPTAMSLDRPAKVTNFTVQSNADSVTLYWNSAGNVRVLRKTGAVPCDPEDGTLVYEGVASSFTDTGLENDLTYYYAIFAYDSNRSYSPRTWLKTRTGDWSIVPDAPAALNLTNLTATTIKLTWVDNSANETGFVVERRISGVWTQIAVLPAGQTTYQDYGLQPNTTYQYQVKAINPVGSSAYAYASASTGNGLVAPTKVSCTVMSYSQVQLEWSDSPNETGYRIQVLNSNGSVIRTINSIPQNTNNYRVTGLSANTKYSFIVTAVRGSETADAAETELITTQPKFVFMNN